MSDGGDLPSGYLLHSHGLAMPIYRNRWFTVLNSMVIFHGYVSHHQRVYFMYYPGYIYGCESVILTDPAAFESRRMPIPHKPTDCYGIQITDRYICIWICKYVYIYILYTHIYIDIDNLSISS